MSNEYYNEYNDFLIYLHNELLSYNYNVRHVAILFMKFKLNEITYDSYEEKKLSMHH